jgi:hypothetical protein
MLGKTISSPEDLFQVAEERLQAMRIEQAVPFYKAAESAGYGPDACSGGRWICHMLLGDFESAWRESDAIQKRGNPDPHRFWNGRYLKANPCSSAVCMDWETRSNLFVTHR